MVKAELNSPLRIPYPAERCEDRDALDKDAWGVIRMLKEYKIECHPEGASCQIFGDLFSGFAEELHLNLEFLNARTSPGIHGIELMDIYDGKVGVIKE